MNPRAKPVDVEPGGQLAAGDALAGGGAGGPDESLTAADEHLADTRLFVGLGPGPDEADLARARRRTRRSSRRSRRPRRAAGPRSRSAARAGPPAHRAPGRTSGRSCGGTAPPCSGSACRSRRRTARIARRRRRSSRGGSPCSAKTATAAWMMRSRTCCSWAAERRGTRNVTSKRTIAPTTLTEARRSPQHFAIDKGNDPFSMVSARLSRHDWGTRPMFSAWGAFVYRFRRPIAVLAVLLAVASTILASQVTGRAERRRLDRSGFRIGGRRRPARRRVRRRRRLDRRGLPRSAGRRRPLARVPGHDRRRRSGASSADDRVDGTVGWAQTDDDRFISTDGTSAYVVVRLDDHRRGGGRRDARPSRAHRPAGRT